MTAIKKRGRPKSWATRLADELTADSQFWIDWWVGSGSDFCVRTADLLPPCAAFGDVTEQTRVVRLGTALSTLARRRTVIDLGDGERAVVQLCPNEDDPRFAGGWRLWPVPAGAGKGAKSLNLTRGAS